MTTRAMYSVTTIKPIVPMTPEPFRLHLNSTVDVVNTSLAVATTNLVSTINSDRMTVFLETPSRPSEEIFRNETNIEVTNESNPASEPLRRQAELNSVHVNFDYVNIAMNSLEVATSREDVKFQMEIVNRTDIFKGIQNGAVYLHAKTGFMLDLAEHANDFCLTSRVSEGVDLSCSKGWSVSFWFKIFSRVYFDKTILQVC